MQRLTRELANADAEISAANTTINDVQTTLQDALRAAGNCQADYEQAPPHIRRWINQGFFKKLFIGPDGSVERYELTEPFATLLTVGQTVTLASPQAQATATAQIVPTTRTNADTVGKRHGSSTSVYGSSGDVW